MKICGRLLLMAIVSLLTASCLGSLLDKPSVTLREITLKPRSLTEANLLLGFDVQNPNRFDLTLKSFQYAVYLDKDVVGSGRLGHAIVIPSSSTTQVQVPVAVSIFDLSGGLKFILTGQEIPYRIEGDADVGFFLGSRHFLFSKEGRINIVNELFKK